MRHANVYQLTFFLISANLAMSQEENSQICAHVYTTIINHCDILRDRLTLSDFTTKRTVFVRGEGFRACSFDKMPKCGADM